VLDEPHERNQVGDRRCRVPEQLIAEGSLVAPDDYSLTSTCRGLAASDLGAVTVRTPSLSVALT